MAHKQCCPVVSREAHALPGKRSRFFWGAQCLLAVTTEVAPAKVIREDINDIGPLCLRLAKREQQAKRDEQVLAGKCMGGQNFAQQPGCKLAITGKSEPLGKRTGIRLIIGTSHQVRC